MEGSMMSAPVRGTIVTLGGGGFSMSDDGRSLIDDHLIGLTGAERPKVCFIPTASGDASTYCERFESAFAGRAETSVLSLFCQDPWGYTDPSMLLDQDLVYVGGGSTANLLAVWRHHGLPDILRRACAQGTVLAGISAGMNCWYEASSTDSYGPLAPLRDGLGFLPGGACPHLLGEDGRRASLRRWVATGEMPTTYAADDHVALVWRDGAFVEAVTEAEGHPALRVERAGDQAVEHEIPVRLLG
ncbi:peptidase E [Ornithinimicrobium pratense]|uniref:Peptidase E n=1 Tax=Ornithinimicrobium pratense TaxID=2593973 RepID=A0A5J6V8Y8_9MICO|nr:peptidase E [Ornithinimicrobium pratense]QFG69573.1 peptidase E [Ornithinimicrobium pratense]